MTSVIEYHRDRNPPTNKSFAIPVTVEIIFPPPHCHRKTQVILNRVGGKKWVLLSKKKCLSGGLQKKVRAENYQKTLHSMCREHVSSNVKSVK